MTTALIGAALLPAIILCVYIYIKDRVEKEPAGLLLKLLFLGALICFPAAYAERFFDLILNTAFEPLSAGVSGGELLLPGDTFLVYNFIKYFVGVALIEEFFKWIILRRETKNEPEFNSLFDGIIYSVFVSLGFAAFENCLYVLQYGFGNAVMRGILSVPGHMFFGVMMGYNYSMWNIHNEARLMEKRLMVKGVLPYGRTRIEPSPWLTKSLVVPTLAHGFYDFCCTAGSLWAMLFFYGFVIYMYVSCFKTIRKMSRLDAHELSYARRILIKNYPGISEEGVYANDI